MDGPAGTQRERVVGAFLDGEGRLTRLPARRGKRLVVLDHLVQVFEPGVRYPETEVNALLRAFHDDVALLRRALVDEAFLSRAEGTYWRTGGTVRDRPRAETNPAPAAPEMENLGDGMEVVPVSRSFPRAEEGGVRLLRCRHP